MRHSGTRKRQVALGAPRAGVERTGKVFIVENSGDEKVTQVAKLIGSQSGEYFGAALAVVDINGDGIDELIVGSPLFTHTEKSKGKIGYEEGKISGMLLCPAQSILGWAEILKNGKSQNGHSASSSIWAPKFTHKILAR